MSISLERRLDRIEGSLGKKNLDICGMADDELAGRITGNPEAMACDLTEAELRAIAGRQASNQKGD